MIGDVLLKCLEKLIFQRRIFDEALDMRDMPAFGGEWM